MISQPDAGREIVEVGRNESARTVVLNSQLGAERGRQWRVLSTGSDQRDGVEIESGLVVIGFFDGSKKFVAEAQVESKPRSHFEVIESIDGINLAVIDDVRGQTGNRSAVADALQESGEGLAAGAGVGRDCR